MDAIVYDALDQLRHDMHDLSGNHVVQMLCCGHSADPERDLAYDGVLTAIDYAVSSPHGFGSASAADLRQWAAKQLANPDYEELGKILNDRETALTTAIKMMRWIQNPNNWRDGILTNPPGVSPFALG